MTHANTVRVCICPYVYMSICIYMFILQLIKYLITHYYNNNNNSH